MLERKRLAKTYHAVPGDDIERDVELGEGIGEQETGIIGGADGGQSLEAEVDNWDENAEDWDEDDTTNGDNAPQKANGTPADDGPAESKKRTD